MKAPKSRCVQQNDDLNGEGERITSRFKWKFIHTQFDYFCCVSPSPSGQLRKEGVGECARDDNDDDDDRG